MAGNIKIKCDPSDDEATHHNNDKPNVQSSLNCSKCSLTFSTGTDLINHLNIHTSYAYPYTCSICNKVFNKRQVLKNHYLSHIERVYYTCPVCSKIYKSCKPFKDHLSCHTGYSVDNISIYCNVPFHDALLSEENVDNNSENTEQSHDSKSIDSPDNLNTRKCSKCDQTFKRKIDLCTHLRTSNCMKPYTCSMCGKQFHQKQSLRNHHLTHQDEKIRTCPMCDKAYKSMKPFADHLASHDLSLTDLHRKGENSATLEDDEDQFNHVHSTNSQSVLRNPGRPTSPRTESLCMGQCSFCPLVYNQRDELNQHIQMVHANTDQYTCFICHEALCHPSEIQEHLSSHARSSLHICPVCEKIFENYRTFKSHFDLFHCNNYINNSNQPNSSLRTEKISFDESIRSNSSFEELRPSLESAFVSLSRSSSRSYTCSFCLKIFDDQASHWEHQRSQCTMRRFGRSYDLMSDSLPVDVFSGSSSSIKQPYHCLQCSRSFAIQNDLRIHEQTHSNENNFKCSCGQICENMSLFINHLEKRECYTVRDNHSGQTSLCDSYHSSLNSLHHAIDFSMK